MSAMEWYKKAKEAYKKLKAPISQDKDSRAKRGSMGTGKASDEANAELDKEEKNNSVASSD